MCIVQSSLLSIAISCFICWKFISRVFVFFPSLLMAQLLSSTAARRLLQSIQTRQTNSGKLRLFVLQLSVLSSPLTVLTSDPSFSPYRQLLLAGYFLPRDQPPQNPRHSCVCTCINVHGKAATKQNKRSGVQITEGCTLPPKPAGSISRFAVRNGCRTRR